MGTKKFAKKSILIDSNVILELNLVGHNGIKKMCLEFSQDKFD